MAGDARAEQAGDGEKFAGFQGDDLEILVDGKAGIAAFEGLVDFAGADAAGGGGHGAADFDGEGVGAIFRAWVSRASPSRTATEAPNLWLTVGNW